MSFLEFPFRLIDLTHTLSPSTPSWNGSCGFQHTIQLDYARDVHIPTEEVSFQVQQIKMHAGIGTHIDAPSHCIPGGLCIEALPLESLLAPCVVIDLSKKAHPYFVASSQDIKDFETQHGRIERGCVVVVRTGWDERWNEPERYRNDYHFPCISGEAAEMLLEREVVGLGVDTLSPDRPEMGFPVHKAFLGAGKYLIENLTSVDQLPVKGSYILSLPIKTLGGTEAPARCIALVPRDTINESARR